MGVNFSTIRAQYQPVVADLLRPHLDPVPDMDGSNLDMEGEYDSEMDDIEYHPTYTGSAPDDVPEMYSSEWYRSIPAITMNTDTGNNGLILGEHSMPEEMLCLILSYVEPKTLMSCRLVCHRWRSIIDCDIWRLKLRKDVFRALQNAFVEINLPFSALHKIHRNKPFDRNLIKNPSGRDGLRHWEVVKNGGDGWVVEDPPQGAEPLLDDGEDVLATSCFATSFSRCTKVQLIDLCAEGLAPVVMDELKPTIYVSEWYAARFDCACTYTLLVVLLNHKKQKLLAFKAPKKVEQWEGKEWHKVEHKFKNYCKGVRYVKFFHSGCDSQFWKGHYGSKMSRACVKVLL